MKVVQAEFVKSALRPEDYPKDRRPEIAFVGRSNVGKSSLLNKLLRRNGLAKTSGTPGKTQTVNFFDVNGTCYFVDLPGYGYAKVPLALKKKWNQVMVAYLRERATLRLVLALVDARHKPTENDVFMLETLEEAEKPTLIVATKWDKLKRSEHQKQMKTIQKTLVL
ncbi:MAG: YihA family ribosome biogenesis GTP-binding protein, partial [Candidatus Hydrogenedentes bacterium]|nr:YihA family ribosome biogenesis GTP-binding protein [Candidatus Hydrogenedentota bacterium]